eukprot:3914059-Rhodomonas_salina.1
MSTSSNANQTFSTFAWSCCPVTFAINLEARWSILYRQSALQIMLCMQGLKSGACSAPALTCCMVVPGQAAYLLFRLHVQREEDRTLGLSPLKRRIQRRGAEGMAGMLRFLAHALVPLHIFHAPVPVLYI